MNDFFDKNLLQNLVVSVFIFLISILLVNKTKTLKYSGKGWKILMIISWIMILGGVYLFVYNYPNGGLKNIYTGMGFSLLFLGIIVRCIGRFIKWWQN